MLRDGGRKRGPALDDYRKYSWYPAYMAVVLEKDDSKIEHVITDAYFAIAERMAHVEQSGAEHRAIKETKLRLDVLRKERLTK
jgi:hypothetical protein